MKKKYVGTAGMFQVMWDNPPEGFNPEFREGFGKAVHERYETYCELWPNATQEERKAEYQRICDALRPLFPSRKEKQCR